MERMEIHANVAIAAVAGVAVGSLATGGLAALVLRRSFQRRLDAEVAAIKTHYNERLKAQLMSLVTDLPEAGNPFVGGTTQRDAGEGGDPVVREAAVGDSLEVAEFQFTDPLEGIDGDDGEADDETDAPEDTDRERAVRLGPATPASIRRDIKNPYVVSAEEFSESAPGWQQLTITYYAGDQVVCDDKDQPLRNYKKIIGDINALSFGGMSGDPHLRYVRNQEMETDFEIVLDRRAYTEAVLNYGNPNRGS